MLLKLLLHLALLIEFVQSRGGGSTNPGTNTDDTSSASEFCGNNTEECPYCCLDDSTCAEDSMDCVTETDDDYIERRIFYFVGALFALWILYKLAEKGMEYYKSRNEHSKLAEA